MCEHCVQMCEHWRDRDHLWRYRRSRVKKADDLPSCTRLLLSRHARCRNSQRARILRSCRPHEPDERRVLRFKSRRIQHRCPLLLGIRLGPFLFIWISFFGDLILKLFFKYYRARGVISFYRRWSSLPITFSRNYSRFVVEKCIIIFLQNIFAISSRSKFCCVTISFTI